MILFQNRLVERSEATVDIEDRGYQFGDGVYEVIRVYGKKPFELKRHFDRLWRSAKEIELALPFSQDDLEKNVRLLIEANQLEHGHIYMQITRGASPREHAFPETIQPVLTAYTKAYANQKANKSGETFQTITTEDIRWLRCDIKSLNLLGSVMAKQKAKTKGCQEAIFHRGDIITEGSSTNVFIVKDGVIRTHPADRLILNGITRQVIIELAHRLGIPVKEESFSVSDLKRADEVFLTGTTIEVKAVGSVDGHAIAGGVEGVIVRKLRSAFQDYVTTYIDDGGER